MDLPDITQISQMLSDPDSQRAFEDAKKTVAMMKTYRQQAKAERMAPFTQALESAGNQWKAATTDEGRQQANALANLARSNMLKGGFSPTDIDQKYWGNTPGQFQTPTGYEAPVSGYEGLKRMDVMAARRQALSDEMAKRQTEAELTGIDPLTGNKTWGRQYQEAALAKSGSGGGGSSGGLTAYQQYQIESAQAADLAAEKQGLGQQLMTGKLTRDVAIDIIKKNYSAGAISFDKANQLLAAVDAYAPPAAAPAAPAGNTNAGMLFNTDLYDETGTLRNY